MISPSWGENKNHHLAKRPQLPHPQPATRWVLALTNRSLPSLSSVKPKNFGLLLASKNRGLKELSKQKKHHLLGGILLIIVIIGIISRFLQFIGIIEIIGSFWVIYRDYRDYRLFFVPFIGIIGIVGFLLGNL